MCIYSLLVTSASSCSYDSRQSGDTDHGAFEARPDLWSEPMAFGDRAHFSVSSLPAVLSVTDVRKFDRGTYICRVDFRQSPTVYHHVKLDVIGKYIRSTYFRKVFIARP